MKTKFINLGVALVAVLAVSISYAIAPEATAAALPGLFADPAAGIGFASLPAIMALGNVLNVFADDDAFGVLSLTDMINKIPFVPGRAGALIPWNEGGVNTTGIMLDEINGVLQIVNPSPRGGPGEARVKQKATSRTLTIPHYQIDSAVYADEVQGVREIGQEQTLKTVLGVVNRRMGEHTADMDTTLEYQRVGAIKGIILNGDASTLYNLFTEFGTPQETEIDFDLDNASPASGALRTKCATSVRLMMDNLGGTPVMGAHAFCGNTFFDNLLAHPEVVLSYRNTAMAEVLRQGYVYANDMKVYGAFEFGGIVWENYRGSVGGSAFVNTDKCHIFPMPAAPGLYRTVFAPADYMETVNTIGLPRYSKQYLMPNGKGVSLEMQANALSYCTRPKALLLGKRT